MTTIISFYRPRVCTQARIPLRVGLPLLLALAMVSCRGSDVPATSASTDEERTAETPTALLTADTIDPSVQLELLAALRESAPEYSPEVAAILSGERLPAREHPSWPTLTYLLGEVHRLRGDIELARRNFSDLASWAASDPYNDSWGGSGLSALGLWRWLQILDEHGPTGPEEVDRVLEVTARLEETRLYMGMGTTTGLLPAMPLLHEAVAELLAHVAWKNRRPEATRLFLDFLTINSSDESIGDCIDVSQDESTERFDAVDQQILDEILRRGLATRERLCLFRARRLLGLVKTRMQKDKSAEILWHLWENQEVPADVRAGAGYEWANYRRTQLDRLEVLEVLTQIIDLAGDLPVRELALYRRGMVHDLAKRTGDTGDRNVEAFRRDMLELRNRFPTGRLTDDALYQLATNYLFESDLDTALSHYSTLRRFAGPNDYQDSAYYLPALGLIGRGSAGDLEQADGLLEAYVKRYPDGVFRLRSLFWRGRIAERRNDSERASRFFRQVIEEAPYDYFAVRARMHLEEGVRAIKRNLPEPDSQAWRDLHGAYDPERIDTDLKLGSPYHRRLEMASTSGLYRELLRLERERKERLDDIPLEKLDAAGLMPSAALLLATRQDALAARDLKLTADNVLRLSGLLGHVVADWPTALEVNLLRAEGPRERFTELHTDPRYLATAYPDPVKLPNLKSVLDGAAWPIDGFKELSSSLMYATIRHESRFYPSAISPRGALGLFQIVPDEHKNNFKKWNLPQSGHALSEYLLDAENNVSYWVRWVNDEFPVKHRNTIAITLMKHHAGSGNVNRWYDYWNRLGFENDFEYQIETMTFPATRNFLRWTLRDIAIVEAAGFFQDQSGT